MRPSPSNPLIKFIAPAVVAIGAVALGWVLIKRASAGKKVITVTETPKTPKTPKADDPAPVT